MMTNKNKLNGGFTLIEMIVAIAIFTVVALVAVGALLKIVDANKKSLSLKTAINNINFSLDSMSREMRVGSGYDLIEGDGLSGPWTIKFTSSKPSTTEGCNLDFEYRFISDTLEKLEQTACGTGGAFAPLISSDVVFETATVKIFTDSNIQPYAQFHFKGYVGVKDKNKTYFDFQTTVSQRLSD